MRKYANILFGIAAAAAIGCGAQAASLSDQFSSCLEKFAKSKAAASVMLECTAADGKLSACKVLEAPQPINGFDKAAMCVAEILPIGSKTGTIKVPIKFQRR